MRPNSFAVLASYGRRLKLKRPAYWVDVGRIGWTISIGRFYIIGWYWWSGSGSRKSKFRVFIRLLCSVLSAGTLAMCVPMRRRE